MSSSQNKTTSELTTFAGNSGTIVAKPGFHSQQGFKLLADMATVFASSHLVPVTFRANPANAMIACELAFRLGYSPLQVMQNLYIVSGKPGWSSQFLIGLWNSCGRFTPIRYEWVDVPGGKGCRALSKEISTGDLLQGALITPKMVAGEGWAAKSSSKWRTMPEQMYMYRAAAFLVRAYAPELTVGIATADELTDITGDSPQTAETAAYEALLKSKDASHSQAIDRIVTEDYYYDYDNEEGSDRTNADPANDSSEQNESVAEGSQVANDSQLVTDEVIAEETEAQPVQSAEQQADTQANAIVHPDTLARIAACYKQLNPPVEAWKTVLGACGVNSARELSQADAGRVLMWLERKIDEVELANKDWGNAGKSGTSGKGGDPANGQPESFPNG